MASAKLNLLYNALFQLKRTTCIRGHFLDRSSNIVSFDDARYAAQASSYFSGDTRGAHAGARGGVGVRSAQAGRAGSRARGQVAQHSRKHAAGTGGNVSEGKSSSLANSLKQAKRAFTKKRADQAFDKAYGEGVTGATAAAAQAGGPRAAVYKTQMGASHKRAAKIQQKAHGARGAGAGAAAGGRASDTFGKIGAVFAKIVDGKAPAMLVRAGVVCACCLVMCVSLYAPAQTYYQQVRERDRLTAEYAAISDRNDYLQSSVDYLQTDQGVEDKARSDFGLVQDGESTAAVVGVEAEDSSIFVANVAADSVPAPDTWYSGVLDAFFAYQPQQHQS